MKTYLGSRTADGRAAVDVEHEGETVGLPPRHDLRELAPQGFDWSASGTGPAQLALALAADCLGDDAKALEVYQALQAKLVARLPLEGWELTEAQLRRAIDGLERKPCRVR